MNLESRIRKDSPDILITSKDGSPMETQYVKVDPHGYIESVITIDEVEHSPAEFDFHKNALFIPGLGYITDETRVVYKEKDYVLLFGWHTNISNQTIYSWHLTSTQEDIPPKTLYQEMINEIELVHFR